MKRDPSSIINSELRISGEGFVSQVNDNTVKNNKIVVIAGVSANRSF